MPPSSIIGSTDEEGEPMPTITARRQTHDLEDARRVGRCPQPPLASRHAPSSIIGSTDDEGEPMPTTTAHRRTHDLEDARRVGRCPQPPLTSRHAPELNNWVDRRGGSTVSLSPSLRQRQPYSINKPRTIQGMLDFDFSCKRSRPSVATMIYPFGRHHVQKFWGTRETLLPVYTSLAEAIKKYPDVDGVVNFASSWSVYSSTFWSRFFP
ncbi:hypothetical protein BU15DRAFT_78020 [Melanogaster broomeanus]|nr:hypothetical protein BU15DRAFT_78020 [Melanogaster broomeanus]